MTILPSAFRLASLGALSFALGPGCLVYDESLFGAAESSGGGSGASEAPSTGGVSAGDGSGGSIGTGGDGLTASGGTAAEPTGTGGSSDVCEWTRAEPLLTNEPVSVIDDFSDGDNLIPKREGRDGAWYSINDGSGGFQDPAVGGWNGIVMPLVEDSTTNRALHYIGQGFTGSGNGDGWHLFVTALADGAAYDLSAFHGISFWVRAGCEIPGSEQALLRVALSDAESEASKGAIDHAGSALSFELTHQWQQVKLPFDTFTRRFGGAAVFDPAQAINLYFSPRTEGALDVWIDDLVFYADE